MISYVHKCCYTFQFQFIVLAVNTLNGCYQEYIFLALLKENVLPIGYRLLTRQSDQALKDSITCGW